MHVLDFVESPDFLHVLHQMVAPIGCSIDSAAIYQPQGSVNAAETQLIDAGTKFVSPEQSRILKDWWLKYQQGARLPTWDLAVTAMLPPHQRALILVEAKAHAKELCRNGKDVAVRKTPDQQLRSNANHLQIQEAIKQANDYLSHSIPGINFSSAECYQFANRVAWAWKLASLGVPVALVYLGFVGDKEIAQTGTFSTAADWYRAFVDHIVNHFPISHLGHEIPCGQASFWLIVRALEVKQRSASLPVRREWRQAKV